MISVITVVKDNHDELEKTIQSVAEQNYHEIEYIVIDGGSKKPTLDIITKYEKSINRWISESDDGIYDAMNKGLRMATGDWVLFLNAGDCFYSQDTLKKISSCIRENVDAIYGNTLVKNKYGTRIWYAGPLNKLWYGMQFSHQSVLVRKRILDQIHFDTKYRIAADYKFMLQAYNNGSVFVYYKDIISVITSGGVSDKKRFKSLFERLKIVCELKGKRLFRLYYYMKIVLEVIKFILKKIIPEKFNKKVMRRKYKLK